jgi:predicted ATPase/DNA-binding SARP family transcriptional activator
MPAVGLVIGILGPFQVLTDGVDVTPRAAKERALLALLVLNRGRVVSADQLIEELWPDLTADRARHALQVRIAGVRSLLKNANAASTVQFVKPGYRLDVVADVDCDRLSAFVARARAQRDQGDVDSAAASLRDALALWRGAPLADVQACVSIESEASRLVEEHCTVLEEYADAELVCGHHHEWVSALEAMVTEEPFRERRWGLLMLALYRCGRQVDALRAFQRVRRQLDEVGLQPGPELLSLERRISVHDDRLAPDTTVVSVRPPDAMRGNLPVPLTSFVGRDIEVKELTEKVRTHRLVTLTGVGGVGKTRLAIRVAAELAAEFPDGVWLVELAPIGETGALPDAVATALGITAQADLTVTASVAQALAGRRLLIVLDNCEHVLDAAAQLVETILADAATVKVMATSREGLRVGAEQLWVVPSLDVVGGVTSPAVELFVQRARAVVAGFVLDTDAEATAVVEICRRLDGIALAIELAAARMVSMSAQDVRDRLGDRFRLLSGARRGLERHQTLGHAVGWSYDLLRDDEQALLGCCAVFADGFDLAAATHVCGVDGLDEYATLDLLDSLVRKSLVTVARVGGHVRYGMLETIRQFAEEQLATSGRISEVRDRHANYFASQALEYWDAWDGSRQRVAADWVDVELANLRVGFRWAVDRGDPATAAAIAAHTALLNWAMQRFEPAGWAEEILGAATAADWRRLPRVYTAASLCMFTGRPEAAVGYAHTAVALEADPRYEPFEAGISGLLEATAHTFAGRIDRCVDICTTLAGDTGFAHVIGLCGLLYTLTAVGRGDEARAIAEETLTATRVHGNPFLIAWALAGYGRGFIETDPSRALATLRQGLVYAREHRVLIWEALISPDVAGLEAAHGELDQALEMFDTTIESQHHAGNVANVATTLASLAVLFDRIDQPDVAATIYGASTNHASISFVMNVPDVVAHLRSVLGETAFDGCVSAGAVMEPADAVRYARHQIQLARREHVDCT